MAPKTTPPTTYVYVDGFNLFFGALQDGRDRMSRKWLDLESFANKLAPPKKFKIEKIKYFTAEVLGPKIKKKQNQQFYWRALATLPKPRFEKIEGAFVKKTTKISLGSGASIKGKHWVEKGTDVNLATHLVNDAHLGKFDVAILVSNDSDLAEAVRIVTQELGLQVIGYNPCINNWRATTPSVELKKYLTSQRNVLDGHIVHSQFSDSLTDSSGIFTKPKEW